MTSTPQNNNLFDNYSADALIDAHDGNMALLYIYLFRHGVESDLDKAAFDLNLTKGEVKNAFEKLGRLALPIFSKPTAEKKPEKLLDSSDEIPQYEPDKMLATPADESNFAPVVEEAQRVLGRTLSSAEIQKLYGFKNHMGLPNDVIFILLHYCVQEVDRKYKDGRAPFLSFIEKEALSWANKDIRTCEAAEKYIDSRQKARSDSGRFKKALRINDRDLTTTEMKYILDWINMGFDTDAVEEAYDRTVTNTSRLKWSYINAIMINWHKKGCHTIEEINKTDSRKPAYTPNKDNSKRHTPDSSMKGSDLLNKLNKVKK